MFIELCNISTQSNYFVDIVTILLLDNVGVAPLIGLDYGHLRDPRWPTQKQDGVWIDRNFQT